MFWHDLKTGERRGTFPLDIGSIVGYSGRKKDTEVQYFVPQNHNYIVWCLTSFFFLLQIFYQFMSFLTPGVIYRCDMTSDSLEPKVRFPILLLRIYEDVTCYDVATYCRCFVKRKLTDLRRTSTSRSRCFT